MEKSILMSDGTQTAEIYRRASLRHLKHTEMGVRVYYRPLQRFITLTETLMPTLDDVGCDFEFERLIDKALRAGFYYTF